MEMLALVGFGVVFVLAAIWIRSSKRQAPRSPLPSDPAFFLEFEGEAVRVAELVLEAAEGLFAEQARALASEPPPVRSGSIPPPTASAVRRGIAALIDMQTAAGVLADQLAALRGGEEAEAEQLEESWNMLSTLLGDRYPVLDRICQLGDLPGLERLRADRAAALALVNQSLEVIRSARSLLRAEPGLVWSQIALVVLTILLREESNKDDAAAAARVNTRPKEIAKADQLRKALRNSMRALHSVPARDRSMHDGVPVPKLPDHDLAAALVRHRITEAATGTDLEKARALTAGEPELLWVALAVVSAHRYPHEAAEVYARLAPRARPLVRPFIVDGQANSEGDAAYLEFEEAVQGDLQGEVLERALALAQELRKGAQASQSQGAA